MSDAISNLTPEQLRDELRFAHAEYTQLQGQHSAVLRDHRADIEGARKAAQIDALERAQDYALAALADLLDPLRTLLSAAGKLDQRHLPEEREAVAEKARSLALRLERDPNLLKARRVAADMAAAHNRLIKQKAALWDVLETVRQAVRPLTLAELQEQEYQP